MNASNNSTFAPKPRSAMVSFATLLVVLFLAVMMGLVFNSGQVITSKIETQNAADAVAYSSSVWVARSMNAITAANHMAGELQAMYVLHHALGGRFLAENPASAQNSRGLNDINAALRASNTAQQVNPGTVPKPSQPGREVLKNPNADEESTIYQAKRNLKLALTVANSIHATAGVVEQATPLPPVRIAAIAVQFAALASEWKIYQEYVTLTFVEQIAQASKQLAFQIAGIDGRGGNRSGGLIEIVVDYSKAVTTLTPAQVQRAAGAIAERYGADGLVRGDVPQSLSLDGLLQGIPSPPVERHLHQGPRRAQLMRAMYPWVAHWRRPLRQFFRIAVPISLASREYRIYTNLYSEQSVIWMRQPTSQSYNYNKYGMGRRGKDVRLYVLNGLNETAGNNNGFAKTNEMWNKPGLANSREAETHFSYMGFAVSEAPTVGAPSIYRQENPDGLICFSQSMIYNANPQAAPTPNPQDGQPQVTAGWDTLNFTSNAIEFETDDDLSNAPVIKLNWQARLTPATLTKLATTSATTFTNQQVFARLTRAPELLALNNH